MSEIPRFAVAVAGLGLGATVLAGCNINGGESFAANPTIPRCYDQPQPDPIKAAQAEVDKLNPGPFPTQAAGESYTQYQTRLNTFEKREDAWTKALTAEGEPPLLKVPVKDGIAQGDPIEPNAIEAQQVTDNLVEVTTSEWKGTGFVTEARGQQYVITAAHVVGTAAMKQLTLTTQDGRHFKPTTGCYMFEESGKFSQLTDNDQAPVQDVDIAVLEVPPISNDPLQLSDTEPKPGTWVDFINYQAEYGPNNSKFGDDLLPKPAMYTGVVTPGNFESEMQVVTGAQDLGPKVTNVDFDATHMQPGASGGPVLLDGKVIGISDNGNKDDTYEGPDLLKELDYISFPGADNGPHTGFQPVNAGVVPANLLAKALASPHLP